MRQCLSRWLFEKRLQELADGGVKSTRLEKKAEANRALVDRFRSSAGLLTGAVDHNEANPKERVKILFDKKQPNDLHHQLRTAMPPPTRFKKIVKKKRGFLVFLLGGLSITVGAALTLLSCGFLSSFGIGRPQWDRVD